MRDPISQLTRDYPYPVNERLTRDEILSVGSTQKYGHDVFAVWTGETRPPRKGEWYLSGAIIEAYRAANDYSEPMKIAELVRTEKPEPSRRIVQRANRKAGAK